MEQGVLIPYLKSKMWIERYDQAGEFKFVADVKSGVRDLLPTGSFVSHVDTQEIMVVENHEISDKKDTEAEIIISGRGFECEFENRIVGSNKVFPTSGAASEYVLDAGYLADQIVTLISNHILAVNLVDDDDALPFVSVVNQVVAGGEQVERPLKRGSLYDRVQDLLVVQLLGTKVIRPGVGSPLGGASPNTALVVHKGVDRTAQIVISEDTGEITSADYLWSIKKRKNAALITGRWVETRVVGPEVKGDRRWMDIDASDIDQNFATEPVGADLAAVVTAMQQRGREALSAQNDVALTKVDVSKNSNNAAYRTDFNVGDLITVLGSYNSSTTMRISEYVEIEDQTGAQSGPTLSLL